MSDERDLPSLARLGDELRAAAERELGRGPAAPPPRRGRRLAAALAALLLAAAAAAGAVELISVGEPVKENREVPAEVEPSRGDDRALSVVAPDPAGGLSWGARAFKSSSGAPCILVGQRRGGRLGAVIGGRFQPYRSAGAAVCGRYGRSGLFVQVSLFNEPERRTVIYGRARSGISRVVVRVRRQRRVVPVAVDGAFLVVRRGRVERRAVAVTRGR